MHFGVITPPVSGHLHPFGALGRELMERGHRVTVFHMADLRDRVERENLDFVEIGRPDHPPGSLPRMLAKLTRLQGRAALRFTIRAIRGTTDMLCRDAPAAVGKAGVEVLLVDQTEPAGGSIAEHLDIPYITVCNALLLNREPDVPPPFTPWDYRPNAARRMMHRLGYAALDRIMAPVNKVVARYRAQWNLPRHRHPEDSFSQLLQISQQPSTFDFPRHCLPSCFRYVGPLRKTSPYTVPFPWEKLDGRPLIYASLGTLQNGKQALFHCFAEACRDLDVQLVITHGGGLDHSAVASLPGDPLVVPYAPQLDVLSRASLTLTHAGLNTVLDSLTHGVPLIAVPITYEQPAIARRVAWTGVGRSLKLSALNPGILRRHIQEVLADKKYRKAAAAVQRSIAYAGGVSKAADLIEDTVLAPSLPLV